ncbi:MAG: amidohydrolase family protein [Anaerococcus vaginalis]|uniref:amidohydrolase family protein n=1 Tax=Anaerococcus vaginalis TaxID=33037 RepID=UPI0029064CDB|nr:amidohydrolase family protein [Anaerococcus vaginalis]MDU4447667.1 amidohydrolase family protein [Anaerococcus vaginalis]MDU6181870.1 amidohydrolase family protein [Anaerococcus vaginalis]MDU7432371.1 amidohydrolase family protein [Anaerococcus vaginalis]
MNIDFRVYAHFYEDICDYEKNFSKRQEVLNIHKNSIATISHIKNQMRLANLDRLVLHAQNESSIDGYPTVTNEEISKLVNAYPDLFYGVASADPNDENHIIELENSYKNLKLKALRLNLSRLNINPLDNRLEKIFDLSNKYKKNIIFECGISYDRGYSAKYANPALYEDLLIKYPKIKFCFTRFAWPYVKEAAMLMMKYKNAYIDTGALYFDSALEFYKDIFNNELRLSWVDRSLNHQIIFASENPRFEQIRMAKAMYQLGLHDKTLKLIMGENARDFLGVSDV